MKVKTKSFMISLLMAVLMLVAFAFGLTFMPTTAHAETSNFEINSIKIGFNPTIGCERLTSNEIFFDDALVKNLITSLG